MISFQFVIQCGTAFTDLASMHAAWSQETFGPDSQRGPLGALKHLEREAREAQAKPDDVTEYADCLLLILDASRRAGIPSLELLQAALAKLEVNKARKWPVALLWALGKPSRMEYTPFVVWVVSANRGEQKINGYGSTPEDAIAACWNAVRRSDDDPVEHVKS